MPETPLTDDHAELYDTLVARSYFATFERITGHLGRVAAELEAEERLSRVESRVLGSYATRLANTFRALSNKFLMTGRTSGPLPGNLTFDRHESGFPVAQELMVMANDAQQAGKHLAGLPSEAEMKDRMIRIIVGDLEIPTRLQFSLSQRLYYQMLHDLGAEGADGLFWARNDPDVQWLEESDGRQVFLVHWAVFDTRENLPIIYLMQVEDSGQTALPRSTRWPQVQAHLMAQSLAGLKLLTIAQGFDTDFADLHPKRLRRIRLGPMHSQSFTLQTGPIAKVLKDAKAKEGDDWALVWTVEDLRSEREEMARDGWFSSSPRQIFALDPVQGAELGATRMDRMMILPEQIYQVLAEQNPPGLRDVRKFVVGSGGRLIPVR
jgi:hypothetical protein